MGNAPHLSTICQLLLSLFFRQLDYHVVDHFSQLLNRCLFNLELVRVGDGDRSCFLFCDFFGEDGTGLITGD